MNIQFCAKLFLNNPSPDPHGSLTLSPSATDSFEYFTSIVLIVLIRFSLQWRYSMEHETRREFYIEQKPFF